MELLGDVAHVESRFSLFCDDVSVKARYVPGLRQTYCMVRNHLRHTQWYSKLTRLKSMLVLVCMEIVLILTQDRCTVCVEHTIGLEIILDAPDGTPR
jgi:hypothetical protein